MDGALKRETDWAVWGTLCGLGSALGYTLANVSLRAVTEVDPYWVTTIKTLPTIFLALPWLLMSGRPAGGFAASGLMWLVVTGLIGHWGGNVAFQWSLGVIGLALSVPLMMGCLIFSSTLLGRRMLNEQAGLQNWAAMAILLGAIVVLSQGAGEANASIDAASQWQVLLGLLAACGAGVAYALLGVAIRNASSLGMPIPGTLLTVAVTGLVCIGGMAWLRIGWEGMQSTLSADMQQMWLAGFWNAAAFVALTKALELTPLYYVNALNASQTAMAAVAGVWLFDEASSPELRAGVGLTVLGLLLVRNRSRK